MPVRAPTRTATPTRAALIAQATALGIPVNPLSSLDKRIKAAKAEKEAQRKRHENHLEDLCRKAETWLNSQRCARTMIPAGIINDTNEALASWKAEIKGVVNIETISAVNAKWQGIIVGLLPLVPKKTKPQKKGKVKTGVPAAPITTALPAPRPKIAVAPPAPKPPEPTMAELKAEVSRLTAALAEAKAQHQAWQDYADELEDRLKAAGL